METGEGAHVVYDLERSSAYVGAAAVRGPALVWAVRADADDPGLVALSHKARGASLAIDVELDPAASWVVRCDRVDFPPGGVAYRHAHPGPGIRRILHGELTIDRGQGEPQTYRAGEAWLEAADDPVRATASETEDTAFVRVLLLPAEWAGKRTIRYLDPADEEKPKLQRATVLLEESLSS
ncbi:MAG: cupin domain-containing protein [Gaiellaceae bacterium]